MIENLIGVSLLDHYPNYAIIKSLGVKISVLVPASYNLNGYFSPLTYFYLTSFTNILVSVVNPISS